MLPLGVVALALAHWPGAAPSLASAEVYAESSDARVQVPRPASLNVEPPPTLAPVPTATATVGPTATPEPSPTPRPRTYTVHPGDELKYIAADYGVSIWKIIDANDIPNRRQPRGHARIPCTRAMS